MANDKRMDCVILGLLHHEPLSGYEIKKQLDTTLSFFWSGSYGSIYPTLSRLEQDGLVTKENLDDTRRVKIIYSITQDGEMFLNKWLCDSSAKDELRYETLLKLFFGSTLSREQTFKRIDAFEQKSRENLAVLRIFEKNLSVSEKCSDHLHYLLTVKFGIETYTAYLRWCDEAKSIIGQE